MAKVFKKKITEQLVLKEIRSNLEEKLLSIYESGNLSDFESFVTSLTEEQIEILGLNEMKARSPTIPNMGGDFLPTLTGGGGRNPLSNIVDARRSNRNLEYQNYWQTRQSIDPRSGSSLAKSSSQVKTQQPPSSGSNPPNLGSYRPGGNQPTNTTAATTRGLSIPKKALGPITAALATTYPSSIGNDIKLGDERKAELGANQPTSDQASGKFQGSLPPPSQTNPRPSNADAFGSNWSAQSSPYKVAASGGSGKDTSPSPAVPVATSPPISASVNTPPNVGRSNIQSKAPTSKPSSATFSDSSLSSGHLASAYGGQHQVRMREEKKPQIKESFEQFLRKEYVDWSGETVRSYKQLTTGTQKSGGEGTQSGPSVSTFKDIPFLSKPARKDVEPIQLQTRQRHDVQYKERNPEVDNPNLSAKSIFGLDPPSFITKTGKGPEKAIDPTAASGGRETKYADFSEKGQGKTTTSKKEYVPSAAAKEIFDKLEKQAANYEKMLSQTKIKAEPETPAEPEVPVTSVVPKEIEQKPELKKEPVKQTAPKKAIKAKPKDITSGEITRLSLGGPEFYKSKKSSLKEFRTLQEKIMRKANEPY